LVLSFTAWSQTGLPLFIENVGQFDPRALFQVWGGGQTLWITSDAIWITLVEPKKPSEPREKGGLFSFREEEKPRKVVNIRISFPGANPNARLEPFGRLDTVVSYFIGNDPAKWRVAVPVWAGVRYVNLYPGVDLEFRGEAGRVVPRLVAHPGANLSVVRLRVEGADAVALTPGGGGGLLLRTAVGEFILPLFQVEGGTAEPALVQKVDGLAFEVSHPFTAGNKAVSAPSSMVYPQQAVSLLYSGFLGGSDWDGGHGIAVDSSGNAYVTGGTWSSDFPAVVGPYTSFNGGADAFVAKVNPSGTALVYAGFLGGSGYDAGVGIAVDSSGNAYVTGGTDSSDFPAVVGPNLSYNGYGDAFVAKVNPAGTALVYAGFLGGSGSDGGEGIAVDSSGNAYVTGYTCSSDFPAVVGPYTNYRGGGDAFVAKVNPSGTALVYSGFLGGLGADVGEGIAVDSSGNAYVTGGTWSSDFPAVVGPYTSYRGGGDAFVAKVNPSGTALVYAGFLGGSYSDAGHGIAVDSSGNAYVTGGTGSSDFPAVVGPDLSFNGGGGDAFVAKVNPAGTALVYSGFLGGSGGDGGYGIAVDSSGNAYVTGYTYSSDFPAVVGPYTSYNGGDWDAFVAKVNPSGTALVYSGFLGGLGADVGEGIAVDSSGNAYVTGWTSSSDFPAVVGPYTSYNGICDAFVVKLSTGSPLGQGYIQGQVKDASTNKAIQGATVEASGPATSSTTTDSNGNYTLTLPPGTYTLTASASGYQSQTKTGITVATGKTTTVDFALSPLAQLGCIKGRVTDAVSRQGLKGAKVEAKGPITASTTTDSDGSYILPLPPGQYSVTASIPNFYQSLTKTNVNVIKGRDTKLDFALTPIKPQLAFNATAYICGETITLTVTDRAYAGATEIAGPNVLVLKDSKGALIASWNRVPALSNASDKFAVTYRLPNSIKQGKITATYTDPTYPDRKAEATANFTLTWSFAILTDLHIGRWYPGPYDGSEYFLTERLRKALRDIKKMNAPSNPIKFVVVLGDLSESGEKAQLQKVRKIFEEELGNLPWIPVIGNHDVWARSNKEPHFAEVFSDYLDQLCNNPVFGGTFRTQNYMVDPSDPTDLQNYVFECGGIRFICLDFNTREPFMGDESRGPGADAVLYPTTYAWLAENLSHGQPTVLFSHHPFILDLFKAFSGPELDSINELIRQSGADVKATFAGHIHGFDAWWAEIWGAWFSANKEYPSKELILEKEYPPGKREKIPVVTTEALMVGQNQPGVNKAVIRLVKVTENFSLSYNNFAGKYNAYNPRFEYEQEFFYIEFEADCFTKLSVNEKTDYIWDFGQLGIKKGKEVKLTKKELSRLGSGEVTLDVKLTVKGESISYRIKVNVDSLHFFPASCETITMRAVPNPVQDVHTTVFTALGAEAEEIKVEVYDLTGRLVWKGEAEGNELPWDTRDLTGLPLANGVYLYLVYVKVEGEWIVSDVQKLVILR
jgi:predicted MPP superfamily phosphohydrolase